MLASAWQQRQKVYRDMCMLVSGKSVSKLSRILVWSKLWLDFSIVKILESFMIFAIDLMRIEYSMD